MVRGQDEMRIQLRRQRKRHQRGRRRKTGVGQRGKRNREMEREGSQRDGERGRKRDGAVVPEDLEKKGFLNWSEPSVQGSRGRGE